MRSLAQYRIAHHLSYAALAARLGVSEATARRWCRGGVPRGRAQEASMRTGVALVDIIYGPPHASTAPCSHEDGAA